MLQKMPFFLIIAVVMLFTSCSDNDKTDKLLEKAESLLYAQPDSALSVIGSIPINEIVSARQKAEFILLYERILERNSINLIGESDMEEAVAYFERNGDDTKRFLWHFYLGRLYSMAGSHYQAMEQYVQAEGAYSRIQESGYNEMLARLYLYKGDIHKDLLNSASALKMYQKAAEYYKEYGGDGEQLMYTLAKVAEGYEGLQRYEDALEAYGSALEMALAAGKEREIVDYTAAVAGIGHSMGEPSDLILAQLADIYAKYNKGIVPEDNYMLLSELYLDCGNLKEAKRYAQMCEVMYDGYSPVEQAGFASLISAIARKEGDYKKALQYKELYENVISGIMEQEKNNSIREMEQLYYNKQLTIENAAIKRQNRYLFAIYSLLLAILLLGLVWAVIAWRKKIREKNGQIEEYLAAAHEAELSKNTLLGELDVQKEKEKRLKELLENRFAEIRELAGTYYEFGYSKKLQKKVEQLLSLQSFGKDMFEVIENVVNAKNNGAMEKIRANYPSITEENIKLLNLIYAGFSPQEISVILNDTPQNIYVRKSRLKRKIAPLLEQEPEMNFR